MEFRAWLWDEVSMEELEQMLEDIARLGGEAAYPEEATEIWDPFLASLEIFDISYSDQLNDWS